MEKQVDILIIGGGVSGISAALIFGLVIFGRDGKMLTYLTMIFFIAFAQVWRKTKT